MVQKWLMATDAQGRQLSDDGYYYWDGANWQPVNTGATSSQQTQTDAQGRQLSDDGYYYWDGASWQPVSASGGGGAAAGGGYYDEAQQVCRYPTLYVQNGATAPGNPYQAEQSGISGIEVAEIAVHVATMAPDAGKAAWNAATWAKYALRSSSLSAEEAAAADAAAEAAIGAAGALAIGLFIFAVTLEETVYHCGDVCPTCNDPSTQSIDPNAIIPPQVCYEEYPHGDEHLCGNSHNWSGSPIGFNVSVRSGAL